MSISSLSSIFSDDFPFMDEPTAPSAATRPSLHRRKTSAEHNRAMRDLIQPWASLSESPPSCRSIMYASWTRFTASDISSKSSEDMQASVLWVGAGTTPDFNPPKHERVYLGVDQQKPVQIGNPKEFKTEERVRRRRHHRPFRRVHSGLSSSWSTESSQSEPESFTFARQPVKSISTTSLLTQTLEEKKRQAEAKQNINPVGILSKTLGEGALSASMLPSAWETDSEDEDE